MSLLELAAGIASQLEQRLTIEIPVLQVTGTANRNPTPPTIDLYPDDPFQEPDAYGTVFRQATFVVRARVTDLDADSGQTLLLEMMDPASPKSVAAALAADPSIGGVCNDSVVEGPSGWGEYSDASGETLMGCQWRLRTIL
jgi:hypothetical protein